MAVKYFAIYNAAIAGYVAGLQTGKSQTVSTDGSGDLVEPVDFVDQFAGGKLFAAEVDAILQSAAETPSNLSGMVAAGATVVASTAVLTNASQSLPAGMAAIASAAWSQKGGVPVDPTTGQPWTQADYTTIANAVAAQFLEYCASTTNS